MIVHFLTKYNVLGKTGNILRIEGEFPGIKAEDFVFLYREEDFYEQEQAYKIELIEYNKESYFKAVIAAE